MLLQDTARRIARVSREAKIDIDEELYVESFRPHMMDIVNAWCNGCTFAQICKMTDVFEGNIFVTKLLSVVCRLIRSE
jgi:ATP-dependent RNA helicase DOB1